VSYTRNFGFRDLTAIIRDGRNKVPTGLTGADANGYLIGTAVAVDPANAGQLKRPAAAVAPPTALSGIVVYEHIQFQGVDPFLTTQYDPPFIYAPQGRFAQMVHGPGVKVWFKNTAALPLYDGRNQAGATLVARCRFDRRWRQPHPCRRWHVGQGHRRSHRMADCRVRQRNYRAR
jgi:hypothetical protein